MTDEQFKSADRYALRNYIEDLEIDNEKFLLELREELDKHADWGAGSNWLVDIIMKIEQKLK